MTKTCASIGCSPMCFPWGFDEEDEGCAALKLILINQISKLRGEGCTRFAISMDCGVGLYAAEILHGLKEQDDALEMICFVPYEGRRPSGRRSCATAISMPWLPVRRS